MLSPSKFSELRQQLQSLEHDIDRLNIPVSSCFLPAMQGGDSCDPIRSKITKHLSLPSNDSQEKLRLETMTLKAELEKQRSAMNDREQLLHLEITRLQGLISQTKDVCSLSHVRDNQEAKVATTVIDLSQEDLDLLASVRAQVAKRDDKRDENRIKDVFLKYSEPSCTLKARPQDVRRLIPHQNIVPALQELDSGLDLEEKDKSKCGLDYIQFVALVKAQMSVEEWARSVPLFEILADAIPRKQNVSLIRVASELSAREIEIVSRGMQEGIQKMLETHVVMLKKTFMAMDQIKVAHNQSSKYSLHKMNVGTVKNFHEGLKGRIGSPHLEMMKVMGAEHCRKPGYDFEFHTTNYDIRTTPAQEWGYVVLGSTVPKDQMVQGRKLTKILDLMNLDVTKSAKLTESETIAVVLYTSPMFFVYNSILRHYPEDIFKVFKQGNNLFPTTIHVLVSAVIKLCRSMKLPSDLTLYRGLGGVTELPPDFFEENELGIKGFAEWGFMSTTSEKRIAYYYSGVKEGKPRATVLVIRPGAVDRGACIKEYSQFPAEIEYLWLPLSYIESDAPPYIDICSEGFVTMVPVRVNANHKALTIDDMINRKKEMHIAAFEFQIDELRTELGEMADSKEVLARWKRERSPKTDFTVQSLVESILKNCKEILETHRKMEADQYTVDEVFRGLVTEMLQVKVMARSKFLWWLQSQHPIDHVQVREIRRAHRERIMIMERELQKGCQTKQDNIKKLEEELAKAKVEVVEFTSQKAKNLCNLKGLTQGSVEEKNEMGENAIQRAVCDAEDAHHLKLLVDAEADVNCVDKEQRTLIELASQNGHAETLKALLDLKAEVTPILPMSYAAQRGHKEVIRVLISEGLVEKKMINQGLITAAEHGHADTVELLLQLKADIVPMYRDNIKLYNWNALIVAASENHADVVEVLMKHGADSNYSCREGFTALMIASKFGHAKSVGSLLKYKAAPDYIPDRKQAWSPIMWAALNGHNETVKVLMESKADVNYSTKASLSTVWSGFRSHICTLLSSRSREEWGERALSTYRAITKAGMTPVMVAALTGQTETVHLLHGNPNMVDEGEWTALMLAAEQGHTATARILKDLGANIGSKTKASGSSAIYLAAQNGKHETVRYLSEQGADVNVPNFEGMTPLMISSDQGHIAVVKALIELRAKVDTGANGQNSALMFAAKSGKVDVIETLIAANSSVNGTDSTGCTALMRAAKFGQVEAVKMLKQLGADVNSKGTLGMTALLLAAEAGKTDTVRALVEDLDANVNETNDDNRTALMIAALHGHEELVRLLVEELKADPDLVDNLKATARKLAESYNRHEIVKILSGSRFSSSLISQRGGPDVHTLQRGATSRSFLDSPGTNDWDLSEDHIDSESYFQSPAGLHNADKVYPAGPNPGEKNEGQSPQDCSDLLPDVIPGHKKEASHDLEQCEVDQSFTTDQKDVQEDGVKASPNYKSVDNCSAGSGGILKPPAWDGDIHRLTDALDIISQSANTPSVQNPRKSVSFGGDGAAEEANSTV